MEAPEDIVEDLVVLDLAEVIITRPWAAECIADPRRVAECTIIPRWEGDGIDRPGTVVVAAACSLSSVSLVQSSQCL